MKKIQNNKGFTVVELLVSITLTTVIVLFLIEILLVLKDLYVSTGIKTKMLTKQAVITENLYDDILSMDIKTISRCSDDSAELCLQFQLANDTTKKLIVSRKNNYIKWNGVRTNLLSGSTIGNINVSYEKIVGNKYSGTKDCVLTIDVPIYHSLLERENYGFNIVYQYSSTGPNMVTVTNANFSDIVDAEKRVYLIGTSEDHKYKDVDYVDPGYYIVGKDGAVTTYEEDKAQSEPTVHVVGSVGNVVGETYYLTYIIYDMNGSKMSEVTRSVTVIEDSKKFTLTKTTEVYEIPVSGTYLIEAWGASGGGTALMRGKGGYTYMTINLNAGDKLYINVGGAGIQSTDGTAAAGGYNGGGASGASSTYPASSGGGASDVRLNSSDKSALLIVAGGGGGGGAYVDTRFTCFGGSGGGTEGTTGTCSSITYVGSAGTSTAGGAAATYNGSDGGSFITAATAGSSLKGGIGATYKGSDGINYASGGGGGGYYGGGGGSRYGGGGGGSGYCKNCTVDGKEIGKSIDGTQAFISPDGITYEDGHDGDGVVKITLKSYIVTQ